MSVYFRFLLILLFGAVELRSAQASVFLIPDFVLPESWALGVETQLHLEEDSGLGAQIHFKKGISDLTNFTLFTGFGNGPSRFRVGSNLVFDIFPDMEGQPGFGFAVQGVYFRNHHSNLAIRATGQSQGVLELTLVPYIHKSFLQSVSQAPPKNAKKAVAKNKNKKDNGVTEEPALEPTEDSQPESEVWQKEMDPFIALPFGWNYADTHYQPKTSIVVGLVMKLSPSFHATFELDMPINNAKTLISGGISYFY